MTDAVVSGLITQLPAAALVAWIAWKYSAATREEADASRAHQASEAGANRKHQMAENEATREAWKRIGRDCHEQSERRERALVEQLKASQSESAKLRTIMGEVRTALLRLNGSP